MATQSVTHEPVEARPVFLRRNDGSLIARIQQILSPLASLRLTVVLMAMAIFIILVATLDQVEKDVWQVSREYFKSLFCWINLQVFFPPAFFPSRPTVPGGFWFPGGKLIGGLMVLNLLAAHGVRFKVQARGLRLIAGLATIALGSLITWWVIQSGSNKEGILASPWINYATIWRLFVAGLAGLWLASVGRLFVLRRRRGLEFWLVAAAAVVLGGLSAYFAWWGAAAQLNDSGMRILWQLIKGEAAALVLLAGCILAFKKRAGVVLLHGGIGLVMLSEVIVSTWAVEAQMHLNEGQATNYVQDIRSAELAIVDTTATDRDQVWAIPQSLLTSGKALSGDELPFRVSLVRFYPNADLLEAKHGDHGPATAGLGLQAVPKELPPSTGTDNDSAADMAAAYVKLSTPDGSRDIGTYLVSVKMGRPDTIDFGGKTYELALRFRRHYKPYSFQLLDVTKDDYLGTETPRSYASKLRLIDPSRHIDQQVSIWMNNPLRFADETFYQSGYHMDPTTGKESTTLSVVSNRGWMIPYIACMIVATGMLAHFAVTLLRFLQRSRAAVSAEKGSWVDWAVPAVVVLGCIGYLASKAVVHHPAGEMDLYNFGKLPLVYEGRVKPFDTLAINTLQVITEGRQEFKDDRGGKQPAIRWLLDVIAGKDSGHQVFYIDNPEVLDVLKLPRREGHLYSVTELRANIDEFERQISLIRGRPTKELNEFQREIRQLQNETHAYMTVVKAFEPFAPPDFEAVGNNRAAAEELVNRLILTANATGPLAAMPRAVPDADAEGGWLPYVSASAKYHIDRVRGKPENPAAAELDRIFAAYAEGNTEQFNRAVNSYQAMLNTRPPRDYAAQQTLDLLLFDLKLPGKPQLEAFFNHWAPFYWCIFLYLFAFVLTVVGFLAWNKPLERAALWLIVATFAVHTLALLIRIDLSGRPPVTNLYSSAVFIGWGCVLMGIVFEMIYKLGIGNLVASAVGAATLFVAHRLATAGDTLVVLEAVLDTQFWLGTHVVCITLGYATTLLAGALGCAYLLGGLISQKFIASHGKDLIRMMYGVLCFAIFFSFVGTVLGGLWADDSWGRFWGWDPKENGALIIVLWNALVLHARWGGMVKDRGLAMLTTAGNIAVCWSWFGVNELGVGLHSYGFTEGVLLKLALFVASQLALIGLAAIFLRRPTSAAA